MARDLEDNIALITGGAGGIGFATAKSFLQAGAKVFLVDLDQAKVDDAVKRLESPAAKGFAGDVSKPETATGMVAACVEAFGGLDVLFANAGIEGHVGPLVDFPNESFSRVLDVNVKGVFYSIKAAVPALVKRKGRIIVTASVAGLVGSIGLSAYVSSKHALVGLMKTAALELAPLGIRVNAVAPGPIDNRMMKSIEEQAAPGHAGDVRAGFSSQIAMGRYGGSEEIAEMVLFLAGARSSYSTGAVFLADGGFVAR